MKKFLTFALALTLVFSLCAVSASAATIANKTGSSSHNVTATYVEGTASDTVYSVEIVWGDMAFTYTDGSEGSWNPETHSYDGATEGSWKVNSENGNKVTVKNHSNTAVKVALTYAAETGFETVTGTFDNALLELETAVGKTLAQTPTATASLTLSGQLPAGTSGAKIGTVTAKIEG